MTIETTLRGFQRHRTTQPVFERLGYGTRVNYREVESLNLLIVADATFVKHALVLQHISLACFALAETVKHRLGNRVHTVANCVDAPLSLAHNLVGVRAIAKVQARVSLQNLTTVGRLECAAH